MNKTGFIIPLTPQGKHLGRVRNLRISTHLSFDVRKKILTNWGICLIDIYKCSCVKSSTGNCFQCSLQSYLPEESSSVNLLLKRMSLMINDGLAAVVHISFFSKCYNKHTHVIDSDNSIPITIIT